MKYLSNLNNLDFDGKLYQQGDELTVNDENRGAAEILYNRGNVTKVEDADPEVTSNDDSTTAVPAAFDADAFIDRGLDDISDAEIAALTDAQRDQVRAAEEDREKPRTGLLSRL